MPVEPIDLREIDKRAANVYEAIIVSAKKARLINDERKLEFNKHVSEIPVKEADDESSEDFNNPQQQKISLDFEKKAKPHIEGLNELLAGNLEFEYKQSKNLK